jgi:tetratricopeptide (TPR) repeat protein
VLIDRRKLLHERAAAALESIFANQLDDHLDELAHHYRHSGNLDKAVEYLKLAGERAYRRSDLNEAVDHQQRALELIALPAAESIRLRAEPGLLLAYGATLSDLGEFGDAIFPLQRALELGQSGRNVPILMQALSALRIVILTGRGPREALPPAERLFELTSRSDDPEYAALGHASIGGVLYYYLCELPAALGHFRRIIESEAAASITSGTRSANPTTRALAYSALTLWQMGYPDQASECVTRSLAVADSEETTASDKVWSYYRACLVDRWQRNLSTLRARAQKTIEMAVEKGFSGHGLTLVVLGWAHAASGQSRTGINAIQQGIVEWRGRGAAAFGEMFEPLADACLLGAEFEEGMRAVADGLKGVEQTGELLYEAELYRIRGELLLARNIADGSAEAAFRTAIEIAHRRNSKSWELRAATSLARLLRDTGRSGEAHAMLAGIYNWFTEGFDTPDLKDAKALLSELEK